MHILDFVPLVSAIFGFLLGLFILSRKTGIGRNKRLRQILAIFIFGMSFIALDYYLFLNEYYEYAGISALYDHLIGFLFYYIVALFVGKEIPIKKWVIGLSIYTILRYAFILPYYLLGSAEQFTPEALNVYPLKYFIATEYLIVGLVNIIMVIASYFLFRNAPQLTVLDKSRQLHFQWIRLLIIAIILLSFGTMISTIMSFYDFEHMTSYFRFETVVFVIFFLGVAFSMMQFPVFVFTGDHMDLEPAKTSTKYSRSSLSDSSKLFAQIEKAVAEEKLYQDQDLKLNTLAERFEKSVHHISQAINENADKSFPDYINQFRVEEAKKKLLEPNPDTIFAIAIDVGFNSKANFYYAFKKLTNDTPTAFRKKYYQAEHS